jgi:hypothetical protein
MYRDMDMRFWLGQAEAITVLFADLKDLVHHRYGSGRRWRLARRVGRTGHCMTSSISRAA